MIAGAIKVLEIYTHDISTVKSNFRMNEKKNHFVSMLYNITNCMFDKGDSFGIDFLMNFIKCRYYRGSLTKK